MASLKGSAQGRLLRLFVFTVPLTQWKPLSFFLAGVTEDRNPWCVFFFFVGFVFFSQCLLVPGICVASALLVFLNPSNHNQWRLGGRNAPILAPCQVLTVWTSCGQLKPCQWLMIPKIWCFCLDFGLFSTFGMKLQDTVLASVEPVDIDFNVFWCPMPACYRDWAWLKLISSQMFAQATWCL